MNPFASFGSAIGGSLDAIGTALHLPELGASEAFNGAQPTQNTMHPAGAIMVPGGAPAQSYGTAVQNGVSQYSQNALVDAYNKNLAAAGGGGGSAPANNYGGYGSYAAQQAAVQQQAQANAQKSQLNTQLGLLDQQQNTGLGNLQNSFNHSLNSLDDQNGVAQRNYDTQTAQNKNSYLNTRNGIMQNTRATANSLQRLLGMNGAGNSSAAYEQAPYAAALQGSTQLSGAQQTYGNNGTNLDTNWQDTQRQYKNSKDDLNQQLFGQQQSLKTSIAQTRADLLSKLQAADGSTAYQGQINDLMKQITGLSNQYAHPVLQTGPVHYDAPNLAGYTLGRQAAIDQSGGQGGAASDVSPLFASLLGTADKRDEFGNPIQA